MRGRDGSWNSRAAPESCLYVTRNRPKVDGGDPTHAKQDPEEPVRVLKGLEDPLSALNNPLRALELLLRAPQSS